MNLDLRKSFGDNVKESDYRCEIDFGFETGQENRCNPNTVLFGTGSFDVNINIFDDDSDVLVSSGKFIVENFEIQQDVGLNESDEEIQSQEASNEDGIDKEKQDNPSIQIVNDSSGESQGTANIETGTGETIVYTAPPEVFIDFQRPSYLIPDGDLYICDSSQQECKVNINLTNSFTGSYKENDYICEIDFGFETDQSNRCNPNTVIFPLGEHDVSIKIMHEQDFSVFTLKTIRVINTGYQETISPLTNASIDEITEIQRIYITTPKIQIQSGLENTGDNYRCKKSDCKVNLIYEVKTKDERCEWSFGGASGYADGTQNKCNPGYVSYGYGDFEIKLRVYQKDNPSNYKQKYMRFSNLEETLDEQEIQKEIEDVSEEELVVGSSVSKIIVQGKIGKGKVLEENKITCYGVEKCFVNFTSDPGKHIEKDAVYSWDFGNGEIYNGKNPKGIWFQEGNYEVKLLIQSSYGNDVGVFLVEVKSEKQILMLVEESEKVSLDSKDIGEEIAQEYSQYQSLLTLGKISPNPKGNDDKEWLEIINNASKTVNMRGCEIDDIRDGGSRSYKIKDDLFIPAGETYRFYKIFTKLNLNNAGDQVNIVCNDNIIDSFFWDFKIGDNLVLHHSYPEGKLVFNSDTSDKFYVYDKQGSLDEILSNEKYLTFINKTFTQNERLLKSGFKISGETIPNAKVRIILGNNMKDIYLTSDVNGLYEVVLTNGLQPGVFIVETELTSSYGDLLSFKSEKELEITSEYIQSLIKIKKAKKPKKVAVKKPKIFLVSVANASDAGDVRKENNYALLYLFIIVLLGFLIAFFAMRKRGVFD